MNQSSANDPHWNGKSILIVIGLAVLWLGIYLANPFNLFSPISCVGLLLWAPVAAITLMTGLQSQSFLRRDVSSPPEHYVTTGAALMIAYYLFIQLAYAVWLHAGFGLYSAGQFERAWTLLGYGWLALLLWLGFLRNATGQAWQNRFLAGGVIATALALLGVVQAFTYVLNSTLLYGSFGSSASELWESVGVPVVAGIGALAMIGWIVVVEVSYARENRSSGSIPWMHFVAPLTTLAGLSGFVLLGMLFLLVTLFFG